MALPNTHAPDRPTRRTFIKLGGAGLAFAFAPIGGALAAAGPVAEGTGAGIVQPFLSIGPDDVVVLRAKHLDMGQGIWSGLASIVAEELDASRAQIRVVGAPADAALYKNLLIGFQATGGSTSIANSWDQLRLAGATARAMLVAAAAQRWKVASDAIRIDAGKVSVGAGSSLRTATFGQLARDAGRLPVPTDVKWKEPSQYRLLGKGWSRLDSRAKSTGQQKFTVDLRRPGMKTVMVVRAPRFGAKVTSFDATKARAVRGVVDVVQVPSGVAIVGETTWPVMQARKVLDVTWDDTSAELRSSDRLWADFRALADGHEPDFAAVRGDPAAAFAKAAHVVDAEFAFPYLAHVPMEPLGAVGEITGDGAERRVTMWGGIQNQTFDHKAVARILELPLDRIDLRTIEAGGSFGRRASFDSDWIGELAEVLKATGGRYPVKVVRTREDDVRGGYYRPAALHRIKAALDADGRIVAWEERIVVQSFLFPPGPKGSKGKNDPTATDGNGTDRYDIPHTRMSWTNPVVGVPVQTFRALAFNHTTSAKEILVDELAELAGTDPLAFRLSHLASRPRQLGVLKLAAEKAAYGRPLQPGGVQGIAVQEAENTFVAAVADVRLVDGRVKVDRVVYAVDCGFVLNPEIVRGQVQGGVAFDLSNALRGAIHLDGGNVVESNFHDYPVLRFDEAPADVQVYLVDSPHPPTGVGEPGSILATAAVANAYRRLTGKPVRQFPIADGAA